MKSKYEIEDARHASEDDQTGGKFSSYCAVAKLSTDVVIFGDKQNPLNITGTNVFIHEKNEEKAISLFISTENIFEHIFY